MMGMNRSMVGGVLLVMFAACGGAKPMVATEPQEEAAAPSEPSSAGELTDPALLEQIQTTLDHKRVAVSRCMSEAVSHGDVDREHSRGKIFLSMVISTSGHAEQITVGKTNIASDKVKACVIEKVKEAGFPELPKPLNWSYEFSFEAS